jgi:UDP-glucuronate 4-epimerase
LLGYTFHHIYQLPVICLRFFTVYGPRQRPDLAIRKFFDLIHRDEPIELYGDGNSSRDYTYIEDIIDAIIKILDLDFKFEILNLGNNTPINLSLLVKLIEDTMGKNASKKYKELPPGDVQRTWADISKARELINYEPIVKMDEGLKEFYVWYKKYTNI